MIPTPIAYVASLALLFVVAITRPDRAECRNGYHVEGIRPSGAFTCRPRSSLPDVPISARQQVIDDPTLDGRQIDSRIYCTNGTQPIVVDWKIVGCQPHGWKQ